MSIFVIVTALVAVLAVAYWFIAGAPPETEAPEDPARGEEKYGGVLPFAATCVAVVLIVVAVYSV
jgi:hypothetical protein